MPRKLEKRNCLKCDKKFESHGAGNRICSVCNGANEKIRTIASTPVVSNPNTVEGKGP